MNEQPMQSAPNPAAQPDDDEPDALNWPTAPRREERFRRVDDAPDELAQQDKEWLIAYHKWHAAAAQSADAPDNRITPREAHNLALQVSRDTDERLAEERRREAAPDEELEFYTDQGDGFCYKCRRGYTECKCNRAPDELAQAKAHGWRYWYDNYQEMLSQNVSNIAHCKELEAKLADQRDYNNRAPKLAADELQRQKEEYEAQLAYERSWKDTNAAQAEQLTATVEALSAQLAEANAKTAAAQEAFGYFTNPAWDGGAKLIEENKRLRAALDAYPEWMDDEHSDWVTCLVCEGTGKFNADRKPSKRYSPTHKSDCARQAALNPRGEGEGEKNDSV